MTDEDWSKQQNKVLDSNLLPEWIVGRGWQGIFDWNGIPTSVMGTQNASQVIYLNADKKIKLSFNAKSLSNEKILKIYTNNKIIEVFNITSNPQDYTVEMDLKMGRNIILFNIEGNDIKSNNHDSTISIQSFKFAD